MDLKQALEELRKQEKKKFDQSVDLIINLKDVDLKRTNISTIIYLPYKIKDKKVLGFLNNKSNLVKTISRLDFSRYRDKKELKRLVKEYDFFIGAAPLMPLVATTFGKVLGPAGKMPSPQLGIISQESDEVIKSVLEKISKALKIKAKETSIKLSIGKQSMSDEQIFENIKTAYQGIVEALPTKRENVKNVSIKLTMGKPIRVEVK